MRRYIIFYPLTRDRYELEVMPDRTVRYYSYTARNMNAPRWFASWTLRTARATGATITRSEE